jgi:hypothetical protein
VSLCGGLALGLMNLSKRRSALRFRFAGATACGF